MPDRATVRYDEIEREIEKMQSVNPKTREESFKSLYSISQELGSSDTVRYLLPFIKTILDTNEEAKRPVLAQIDRIVRELVKDVQAILPIYKEVFLTRDNQIRKEGAGLLVAEVVYLGTAKETLAYDLLYLESFICTLGESKFIMHRLSALYLIHEVVTRDAEQAPPKKIDKLFSQLLNDTSSVVRKRAVSSTAVLSRFYSEAELCALAEQTLRDPEDSVRSWFTAPISLLAPTAPNQQFLARLFQASSQDQSWQIRSRSIAIISQLAGGPDGAVSTSPAILERIGALLNDREAAVRQQMVEQLER